ncbi:MAG: DUF6677 family protein [Pirellulaceae bacterium]
MSHSANGSSSEESIYIDLRNPYLAALLAWLCPGAGHLYQRRYGKGILFLVCILSTYIFGFTIGGGHVVYASWVKNDRRWQYGCQVGVGLPALPAIVQNRLERSPEREPIANGIMAPPSRIDAKGMDQLALWHAEYGSMFELGTLYTMVAGLLNIIVIFDAYAGPVILNYPVKESRGPPVETEEEED